RNGRRPTIALDVPRTAICPLLSCHIRSDAMTGKIDEGTADDTVQTDLRFERVAGRRRTTMPSELEVDTMPTLTATQPARSWPLPAPEEVFRISVDRYDRMVE